MAYDVIWETSIWRRERLESFDNPEMWITLHPIRFDRTRGSIPARLRVRRRREQPGLTGVTRLRSHPAMRRFEFKDAKSHKFWEVEVEGAAYTVRYGRVGADGQLRSKTLASAAKASAEVDKKIIEKTKKGYVELGSKTKPKPKPKPARHLVSTTVGIRVVRAHTR